MCGYLRVMGRRRVEGQGGRSGRGRVVLPRGGRSGHGSGVVRAGRHRVVTTGVSRVPVVVSPGGLVVPRRRRLVRVEGRVEGRVRVAGTQVAARRRRRQQGEGLLVVGHLLLGHLLLVEAYYPSSRVTKITLNGTHFLGVAGRGEKM